MNASIVLVSVALLIYWFRYVCLLILQTTHAHSHAARVAAANRLYFPHVQSRLAKRDGFAERDRLHEMLNRDYLLLSYLIRNASGFRATGHTAERWLLHIDFRLLRIVYKSSRRISASKSLCVLREMADIISHLAGCMGEQALSGCE